MRRNITNKSRGQAFIEMVIILPVLLIMLLGLIEVAYFLSNYLEILDLTREAARFASLRDPFNSTVPSDFNCSTPDRFNFYYDTACVFSPPAGSASCVVNDPFCSGLNEGARLDPERDDVVISVFTVTDNSVTNIWPSPAGYWALSDHDTDTVHNSNWQKDCKGNVQYSAPYFTAARINSYLDPGAPPKRGFVTVEIYYCYHLVLDTPIITQFISNPVRTHAYTVMSLPAAQPTPTPIPTP